MYLITKTSEKRTELIGAADTKDSAFIIMKENFKNIFLNYINIRFYNGFNDAYNCLLGESCFLNDTNAWLKYNDSDEIIWSIIEYC